MFAVWLILTAVCCLPSGIRGELRLEPAREVPCVFGGVPQQIPVAWHNTGVANESVIRTRMMQLSSTTAMPVGEAPWKMLQTLPGQTVLETAAVKFPAVKTETRFLVQWIVGSNHIVGSTEVRVYPTNLLAELKENGVLGVFDPHNEVKPALASAGVEFVDLENTVPENFRGKLAIVGPFESTACSASLATRQIKALSKNHVAVVWVVTGAHDFGLEREHPQPSFYLVPGNEIGTVIVQPEMVANFVESPRSQLNLIYFCRLALHPETAVLPCWKKQP